jgi:hypothetical protein
MGRGWIGNQDKWFNRIATVLGVPLNCIAGNVFLGND